jgi:uncharacterized protein DUF4129
MRPQKSLADYVAIAICPALIMALVGSLMFFLLEILYAGPHDDRMRMAVFAFVGAIVLIARISMMSEISRRAGAYGIVIAVLFWAVLTKYIEWPENNPLAPFGWLINLVIMAICWWTAHKLTWDCTLIDDDEDASGQGLLQAAGLEKDADQTVTPAAAAPAEEPKTVEEEFKDPETWWTRWFSRPKKPKQSHTPGVWIVYYSLAALPLFGLGQMMIPASEPARRRYAFWLLAIYVAAGLGLLLTTSFLGLRRYLRQKKLTMPAAMTGVWLAVGGAFVVLLLSLSAFLPRPNPEFVNLITPLQGRDQRASKHDVLGGKGAEGQGRQGNTAKNDPGGSAPGNTKSGGGGQGSQGSQGKGNSGQGNQSGKGNQSGGDSSSKSNQSGRNDQTGKQGNSSNRDSSAKRGDQQPTGPQDQNPSRSGEPGKSSDGNSSDKSGQGKSSDAKNSGERNQEANKGEQNLDAKDGSSSQGDRPRTGEDERRGPDSEKKDDNNNQQSGGGGSQSQTSMLRETPDTPELAGTIGTILKWLIYIVLALVAIYLLIRYWKQVLEALKGILQSLRNFWARLFGWRREEGERQGSGELEPVLQTPEPFSTFHNPFLDGTADKQPVNETTCYTFEALEAWAHEHGIGREPEETPMEFAARISEQVPELGPQAKKLAENYSRVTYAHTSLARAALEPLRLLWQKMKPRAREMADSR